MQNIARRHSSQGADFWAGHHRSWKESGLSKMDYFKKYSLSKDAGYYWFKKLEGKDRSQGGAIVPTNFTIIKTEASSYQPLKLNISGRFQVEIGSDFQARTLVKLIKTLESMT